jgi:hypothetical protein
MNLTTLNEIPRPTVGVETIDPATAELWLRRNTHNRNIRPKHVQALAHAMASGQWALNGESIIFDPNGVLVDGQHRLLAVVESGATIQSVVVRNVDMSTQITVDVGARRAFQDVLKWMGETDATNLAAAVRSLHRFKYGDGYSTTSNSDRFTYADLLNTLDQFPGIRQSVDVSRRLRKALPVPAGPMAGLHYLLWELSPLDANAFYDRMADGVELTASDPIYMLRRAFLNDAKSNAKFTVRHRLALTIKAWNLWISGEQVKVLVWRSGGVTRERFPVPVGPDGEVLTIGTSVE